MKVGDSMENMIDAKGLVHEYSRRDENGNVTEIKRALDGIDIKVKQGDFIAVWEQMAQVNRHLQNI